MSRLTHTDYELACTKLQQIYGLQDAASFPQQLLALLSTVVQADVYSYNKMNKAAKTAWYLWHPASFEPIPDGMAILGSYNDQNPLLPALERMQATRISDCITTADFQKLPIYHEFYKPMRAPFTMVEILSPDPQQVECVGLHHGRRDFSDRDVLIMNLLRPHIMQAFHQARRLTTLDIQVNGLHAVLDHHHQAAIFLSEDGHTLWSTPRARDIMQTYCPPSPHAPSCLPDLLARWATQQIAAWRSSNALATHLTPLIIEQPHGRLFVSLLQHKPGWLLVFEEQSPSHAEDLLRSAGLTKRETEVLRWVTEGKSNEAIAAILGASPRTIHKHLERIYQKLGVENRTAAAAVTRDLAQRSLD